MKKFIFVVVVCLCSINMFSQENKNAFDGIRKNGVSFNFLGITPVIGITYERVLSHYMSLELGVGTNSAGLGVKILPFKIKESTMMFTTGLSTTYADYKDGWLVNGKRVQLYVPIGLSYYGTKGFNFGIDVGPGYRMYIKESNNVNEDNGFLPWAGIKIGQRF
ncbi:MAG: hypothetical protein ACI9Q9_000578 [Flavobacterium sp.]|jgi:hypothetical protein